MTKCRSCGTENPEDSAFCTGCGAGLTPPPAPGGGTCAGCGAVVPADSRFCVGCGRPVAAGGSPGPAHCTGCGAKLEPGSAFCTGCGAPVGAAAGGTTAGAPAGDMEAALAAYWSGLEGRLAQAGFEKLGPAGGLDADRIWKRQRFDLAKAGKVTTLCAGKWLPGPPTVAAVQVYSQTVFNFGNTQKALLGRSSFQPLVVYPVLVAPAFPPEVQAFLDSHWPKRLQAYEYPVVAALGTREIACHRSTPVWGLAFHAGIKREAETLFQP